MQFSKFIWMISDGVAYKFVNKLENHLSDHAKIFVTHTERMKYSTEVYKTWFTGTINDRLSYKKVGCEIIFGNFLRSGVKTSYIGAKYIQNVYMKQSQWDQFVNVDVFDQHGHNTQPWPFFYEDGNKGQKRLEKYMNNVADKNVSFFAYSTVSDDLLHSDMELYKGKNFTRCAIHGEYEWVNQHPDVLLIMASDHGHDELVENRRIVHGTGLKNNTGYQILYNPRFTPEKSFEMDSLDVAATISNYIQTNPDKSGNQQQGYINIPMNNMGLSRNLFEQSSDNLRAKKQSLAQMINLFDETKKDWEQRKQWRKKEYNKDYEQRSKFDQYTYIVNNIRKFVYNESIYDIKQTIAIDSYETNEDQLSEQIKNIIDSNSETELKRKAQSEIEENGIFKKSLLHYTQIKEQAE
ncbi:MAG: hypothetical protein EZS28_007737, partial [Streblomastix strix]